MINTANIVNETKKNVNVFGTTATFVSPRLWGKGEYIHNANDTSTLLGGDVLDFFNKLNSDTKFLTHKICSPSKLQEKIDYSTSLYVDSCTSPKSSQSIKNLTEKLMNVWNESVMKEIIPETENENDEYSNGNLLQTMDPDNDNAIKSRANSMNDSTSLISPYPYGKYSSSNEPMSNTKYDDGDDEENQLKMIGNIFSPEKLSMGNK